MLFADKPWNKLLEYIKPIKFKFIYVKKNTVNILSEKLNNYNNVIMYLYKDSDSSGLYYILKNTNCNLITIKIKCINKNNISNHYNGNYFDIYMDNLNNTYSIKYDKIDYKLEDYKNSKEFMNYIKSHLYL